MRYLMLFLIIFSSFQVLAKDSITLTIEFQNKHYQLTLSGGKLVASSGNEKIAGQLDKRLGDFSEWTFAIKNDFGFELIINEKIPKIINQKNNLDAGGPFLETVSPDSKWVVFDYGTGPTARRFEVRASDGKVLFTDSYLNQLSWTKQGLLYDFPKVLPINLNAKTKACEAMGSAYQVQLYLFDGKTKKRVNKPPTIECSN